MIHLSHGTKLDPESQVFKVSYSARKKSTVCIIHHWYIIVSQCIHYGLISDFSSKKSLIYGLILVKIATFWQNDIFTHISLCFWAVLKSQLNLLCPLEGSSFDIKYKSTIFPKTAERGQEKNLFLGDGNAVVEAIKIVCFFVMGGLQVTTINYIWT